MWQKWDTVRDGQVLLMTPFDYLGVSDCEAAALVPTSFRRLQETSRFMRSQTGLGLRAFEFVAADKIASRYLKGVAAAVETIELTLNHHKVKFLIDIHNAELHLPQRFKNRKEEEEFHEGIMIDFARKIRKHHREVRVLPIYVRIVDNGTRLEYVSFEGLVWGGKKEVIWTTAFSLKDVVTCQFLLMMCLDFRFRLETFDFARAAFKLPYFHLLGMAGGCHGINTDDHTATDSFRRMIAKGGKVCIAVNHAGCAKYREQTCDLTDEQEEEFHREELRANAKIIKGMGIEQVCSAYARLTPDKEFIQFIAVK